MLSNSYNDSIGNEAEIKRYVNSHPAWHLSFKAKDKSRYGGWGVGIGGPHWTEFNVNRGRGSDYFRYHYNAMDRLHEYYEDTSVRRDDIFHHFEISSNGSRLLYRIDGRSEGSFSIPRGPGYSPFISNYIMAFVVDRGAAFILDDLSFKPLRQTEF